MAVDCVQYLAVIPEGFYLFPDQQNLFFIFGPLAIVSDLGKAGIWKVLTWAVRLSAYNYLCIHISGVESSWAHVLGRWAALETTRCLVHLPVLHSALAESFSWPCREKILKLPKGYAEERTNNMVLLAFLWHTSAKRKIWTPNDVSDTQLRPSVISQTRAAGHCELKSAIEHIQTFSTEIHQNMTFLCLWKDAYIA